MMYLDFHNSSFSYPIKNVRFLYNWHYSEKIQNGMVFCINYLSSDTKTAPFAILEIAKRLLF